LAWYFLQLQFIQAIQDSEAKRGRS